MRAPPKKDVFEFLDSARVEMRNNRFTFLHRCTEDIIDLGLTISLAKQEIMDLQLEDYDRGPTPDHNQDGTDVWEFGKEVGGVLVYIKLKIHPIRGLICMSFKKSDGPFTLPYKK